MVLTSEMSKLIEAKSKRKNQYLQKAYDNKIWDESRPNDKITGREMRLEINRAL